MTNANRPILVKRQNNLLIAADGQGLPETPEYGNMVLGGAEALQKSPLATAAVLGGIAGINNRAGGKVSELQKAIFELILKEPQASIQIEATAGSGKTSTLLNITSLVQCQCLFLAFNKHIVKEIEEKLTARGIKHAAVKTVHSSGYGVLAKEIKTKLKPIEHKYRDLVDDYLLDRGIEALLTSDEKNAVYRLLEFVQSSLSDPASEDDINYLINFHSLDIDEDRLELAMQIVQAALEEGERVARNQGVVSFTDMIWLPWKWDLSPKKFDLVLGDEIQDWNKASLDLVRKCKSRNGRFVLVGDPYQSLYGFAGADPQMWERIGDVVKASNGKEMPLSESFRCAKAIVQEARKYNPKIVAAESNPEGKVSYISELAFFDDVQPGNMVVARRTAPLVQACIKLISRRKKAYVKGRDIGNGLTAIVKQLAKKKGFKWGNFPQELEEFVKAKIDKLAKKKNTTNQIQSWVDKMDGLMACYEGFIETNTNNIGSASEFILNIESIFNDGGSGIELMTIHKSKGLEAEKVFILEPSKLQLNWKGMQPWEMVQERNCAFVAVTRAKYQLVYVGSN